MRSNRHLSSIIAVCLVAALTLVGCGGSSTRDTQKSAAKAVVAPNGMANVATAAVHRYPDSVRKQIVSACSGEPGATKSECECALGQIEKTITYDEFLKADAALRKDANATTDVQDELDAAVNACADN